MIFDIMNIMDKTVNIQDNIAVAWHPDLSEAKEMAAKRKAYKQDPEHPHTGNAVDINEMMKD